MEITEGIVLRYSKYNDNSLIMTCFTKDFGKLTFFVKIYGRKNNYLRNIIQPGFLIEIEFNHQKNRELQKIKNVSFNTVYTDIPTNIVKSSILIMLSEVLDKSLKNQTSEEEIYNFITSSFKYLDFTKDNYVNFHLIFLMKLTDYIGFKPNDNFSTKNQYFDILHGYYIERQINEYILDKKYSLLFNNLLKIDSYNNSDIKLSNSERAILLNYLLNYYSIHIENLKHLKSLNVLQAVFSN